jgi:hypothetical protein
MLVPSQPPSAMRLSIFTSICHSCLVSLVRLLQLPPVTLMSHALPQGPTYLPQHTAVPSGCQAGSTAQHESLQAGTQAGAGEVKVVCMCHDKQLASPSNTEGLLTHPHCAWSSSPHQMMCPSPR